MMDFLRKTALISAMLIAITASFILPAYADGTEAVTLSFEVDSPYMTVNGVKKEIDPGRSTAAVIVNDRTMLPARAIVEEFGGSAEWNEEERSVTLILGDKKLIFIIGEFAVEVNGEIVFNDSPASVINGRTMLPVRFASEKLGLAVSWSDASRTVTVRGTYGEEMKLHFIDVGQGDAVFVELPGEECMLIDAGPDADVAADYISKLGYTHIDYVIATHPDADHITGMEEVLNRFTAGEFYMPQKPHTTKTYERMLTALQSNGCTVYYAAKGTVIFDNGKMSARVLAPYEISEDNNNSSVVIRLSYGETDFMLMGDAEKEVEQKLLSDTEQLDCEVLKVAHHGSKSSTGDGFVNALSPDYAVISVGADNTYGHPDNGVISRLEGAGAAVYRTDLYGTVIISTNGVNATVSH